MINISVQFRSFDFLKIFCLSLNSKSCKQLFSAYFFLPALCARYLCPIIFSTFFQLSTLLSHSSQVSLLFSLTPSILMLFRLERSSSSINFFLNVLYFLYCCHTFFVVVILLSVSGQTYWVWEIMLA